MANHEVLFTIPWRKLTKADVEFIVKRDGEVFGKLAISCGALVWFPKGARIGRKMGWKKFDEVMQESAGRTERRK